MTKNIKYSLIFCHLATFHVYILDLGKCCRRSCKSCYSYPIKWGRSLLLSWEAGVKVVVPTNSDLIEVRASFGLTKSSSVSFSARLTRIYRFQRELRRIFEIFSRFATLWGFMLRRLPWGVTHVEYTRARVPRGRRMHLSHCMRSEAYPRFVKFLATYDSLLFFLLILDSRGITKLVDKLKMTEASFTFVNKNNDYFTTYKYITNKFVFVLKL